VPGLPGKITAQGAVQWLGGSGQAGPAIFWELQAPVSSSGGLPCAHQAGGGHVHSAALPQIRDQPGPLHLPPVPGGRRRSTPVFLRASTRHT